MYQKANYGAINENPTSKTTSQDAETQNDNIVNEDAIYGQGKSPIRSVLWNMLNQIIGTGLCSQIIHQYTLQNIVIQFPFNT